MFDDLEDVAAYKCELFAEEFSEAFKKCSIEEMQAAFFSEWMKNVELLKSVSYTHLADLFSMDHMSKLLLAGIENNRFRVQKERPDIHLHFILDIGQLDGHSVYDVILFVHMLTNYSLLNFTLSQSKACLLYTSRCV